jgi:WD repeat-containing protein 48
VLINISSEEHSPNTSGYISKISSKLCNIAKTKTQMERLDRHMPKWIHDYIVLGRGVVRDPIKISFLLLPDESVPKPDRLKELPNGANRLSANRMLRIKKLLGYITERISVGDVVEGEGDAERGERCLEILCGGTVLEGNVTLARLKFVVWKGGGELEMRYRLKTT